MRREVALEEAGQNTDSPSSSSVVPRPAQPTVIALKLRSDTTGSPQERLRNLPEAAPPGADRVRGVAGQAGALLQASFDSLPALVAILDTRGIIVASNGAWKRFAETNGLAAGGAHHKCNLLSLFSAQLHRCPEGKAVAQGLSSVLSGCCRNLRKTLCWNTPSGIRWFDLRASRIDLGGEAYVIVINDDVTAAKAAEQALSQATEHLMTLQDEERRRIAGELHDSTAQHLAAAGLNLLSLRSRLDKHATNTRDLLDRIESSIEDATRELRSLTYLLHPPGLAADGLEATLRRYIEGFEHRTGVSTTLRFGRRVDRLPPELQHCVLRIVQEALANIHRHAEASCAWVDLKRMLGRLHLVVRGNGRGMAGVSQARSRLTEPPRNGVGIPGIRSRLGRFGGRLALRSGTAGTTLHAIVPLAPRAIRSAAPAQASTGDPAWYFRGFF